jgi:hypothetical protein
LFYQLAFFVVKESKIKKPPRFSPFILLDRYFAKRDYSPVYRFASLANGDTPSSRYALTTRSKRRLKAR